MRRIPPAATRAACGLALLAGLTSAQAVSVVFPGFADTSNLTLNGSSQTTATADGTVLRLTGPVASQSASTFSRTTVNARRFSTYFQFRITSPGGRIFDCNSTAGADGLVFVVQSNSSSIGGVGLGIGYAGIPNSVGVEFDTWCNAANNDPSANHVGFDTGGSVVHAGLPVKTLDDPLDDGRLWNAWIDYDGTTLELRVSGGVARPATATLSAPMDIPALLGGVNKAYVGFTSATGEDWENHDIVYWEYRDDYQPIEVLGGEVDRLKGIKVTCKNTTTGQVVTLPKTDVATFDCEKAGLVVNAGQKAAIQVTGIVK